MLPNFCTVMVFWAAISFTVGPSADGRPAVIRGPANAGA
jgi:hypothetical protein